VSAGEKEIVQTIKAFGGAAFNYVDILESDFAAVAGAAYTPPELGTYRRINVSRVIQFLKNIPGIVETHQTTAATVRLPCGLIATDDALSGRQIWIKNSGTEQIIIQDNLGSSIVTIYPGVLILVEHKDNNNWEVLDARSLSFTKSISDLESTNVRDAIEELATELKLSASPGFTWGMSGTVRNQWILNDTVPSNRTGRTFPFYNGTLEQISVSNEVPNTFDVLVYEHDGTTYTLLTTVNMVTQRSGNFIVTGINVTRGKELAVYIASATGSDKATNPVVSLILGGSIGP